MPSGDERTVASVPRRKVLLLFLATAVAIALGIFKETADPFGLITATNRLSVDIFSSITAPLYGERWATNLDDEHFDSRYGQSNIVVVLIDDDYLADAGQNWPLRMRQYKRIIRNLVDAGASAVFVDIYFPRNSPARSRAIDELFEYTSCLQQSAACGISVAGRQCRHESPEPPKCPEEQRKNQFCCSPSSDDGTAIIFASTLRDPFLYAGDNSGAAQSGAPASALAEMHSAERFYRLRQKVPDDRHQDTAAWAIYKAWCARDSLCDLTRPMEFTLDQDMFLYWGYAPNRMMTGHRAFGGQDCQRQSQSAPARLLQSIEIFGWNLLRGFQDNRIAPCPYTSQINLKLFNSLPAADLRELFEGKAVLLGASLADLPDYKHSPVHDYVPGVFWHAMAVDNLIEFGEDFPRAPGKQNGISPESTGLAFILVAMAFLSWAIERRNARDPLPYLASVKLELLHGLVVICIVSAVVLWMTGLRQLAPQNWVGIVALMLLVRLGPLKAVWPYSWLVVQDTGESQSRRNTARMVARSLCVFALLLFAGFCAFTLPHALILAQVVDGRYVSYIFLTVYLVTSLYCTWKIMCGRFR